MKICLPAFAFDWLVRKYPWLMAKDGHVTRTFGPIGFKFTIDDKHKMLPKEDQQ